MNSLKKRKSSVCDFCCGRCREQNVRGSKPQFKTLNVYDGNLQRINHRESKEEKKSEEEKTSEKQSDKKQSEAADDNSETPSANNLKKEDSSPIRFRDFKIIKFR